ncbi:MAG: hypothetical protein P1U68_01650 [Verrucomicrobiales bacterium]|nr:hypothetical protein [Verrucomicrobiales bacterium]
MKILLISLLGLFFPGANLPGEESEDPADLWYRGFLAVQSAEELIQQEREPDGLNALDEAFSYFKRLILDYPEFHTEIVKDRIQQTAEDRFRLIKTISKAGLSKERQSGEVKRLETELEELKTRLRKLREDREVLDRELQRIRAAGSEVALGFDLNRQRLFS